MFSSWLPCCRRASAPPVARRDAEQHGNLSFKIPSPSGPAPPPPPTAASQGLDLSAAAAIVEDCEFVLAEDAAAQQQVSGDDALLPAPALSPPASHSAAVEGAAHLRIVLLGRGARAGERDVRMRYVNVAAERLFVFLDAMQPVDESVREARRCLIKRLLAADKCAERVARAL
jgi:hypothetical protein